MKQLPCHATPCPLASPACRSAATSRPALPASPRPPRAQIKILSKLAADDQRLQDGSLLRNSVIGLREIVRSSSHKANNYKVGLSGGALGRGPCLLHAVRP